MRLLRSAPVVLLVGLLSLGACVGENVAPSNGQTPNDDGGRASPSPDASSAADAGSGDAGSNDGSSNCIVKTSGLLRPTTLGSVGGAGVWSMPANAKVADGMFASAALSTGGTLTSDSLEAKNFGFTIPPWASIRGIEVHVTRGPGTGAGFVKDKGVAIGDVTGQLSSEKRDDDTWARTAETVAYGGGSDSWGLALTPQLLASSNFGVWLSAVLVGSDPISAEIDAIAVEVTYCE